MEIEFISESEFDLKYGIHPLSRFLGGLPRMTYDQSNRKILIRNLVGLSEYQVYCLLCHEILHAVLHEFVEFDACLSARADDVLRGNRNGFWKAVYRVQSIVLDICKIGDITEFKA